MVFLVTSALFLGLVIGWIASKLYAVHLKNKRKNQSEEAFRTQILGDLDRTNFPELDTLVTNLLGESVDDFLALQDQLRNDLEELLEMDQDTPAWRRRVIRESISYVEAVCSGYQRLGAIAYGAYGEAELSRHYSKKQIQAIRNQKLTTAERIKCLTKVGHKVMFNNQDRSDFTVQGWVHAQRLIDKRHRLTHPSGITDISITNEEGEILRSGAIFLINEVYKPLQLMNDLLQGQTENGESN